MSTQYYWGVTCIGCGKLHPVKLATPDHSEEVPNVPRFQFFCPTAKDELLYDRNDLIKYLGPKDKTFQTHQLFQ